ncbi:hypothetical protein C9F04_19360, partial [Salmonella enterica subsp. enterica serovar Wilhelmsburg]
LAPKVATGAQRLFPQQEWPPTLAGKHTCCAPFEIESLTLQTTRYLPVIKEVQYCSGLFLLLPPYFLAGATTKKTNR